MACLCVLLLFGACTSQIADPSSAAANPASTAPESQAEGDKIRIGISCCLMQNEFYARQMAAYKNLVAEKYPNVEIVSILDGDLDLQKDIDNITTFVSQKVDLIIISLSDFNSAQEIINLAQGIPIVFTNRQLSDQSLLDGEKYTYIGSSEREGGVMQGEYLGQILKEKGATEINYICFQGELGAQNAMDRTEGHLEGLAKSGLQLNEVLNDVANWDRTEALQKTEQAMGSNKNVNCIVANNDEMALGAIEALKAMGVSLEDVAVGGMDGVAAALQSMQAGELKCTVLVNAEEQAAIAMEAAVNLASGKTVEPIYWVPFELITPDNIADYL